MLVEEQLAKLSPEKDMFLTIGVFDGVHLGHQFLIAQLVQQAREQNLLSGVITFRQHPQEALFPQVKIPYLTSLATKVKLLKKEGVDVVITLPFTPELAQLSARQFVTILIKYLRMRGLIIGYDFALGRGREGDADILHKLGQEMSFSAAVFPPLTVDGEIVSSTAIRNAITTGDLKRAARLLGRPFSLQGRVITGVGRSTKQGFFPTANLKIDSKQALPADGVYATRTHISRKVYPSMTNIGRRPTFNGNDRTIETYILDYRDDLYGRQLKIDIIERLRDEKRFETIDELKKQIDEDIKKGRVILNSPSRR
ncbi:MAG: bifunctional riboflavin kinase/FAD synthetase [Dehalococcoidales bacterium]|nr:bifunctional riboflavin kinase/FAD synthetase [Dehalococcoidales bacterium]